MVMPAWPSFFPLPQRQGNSRSPADLAIRSTDASGPALARRRSVRARESCPVAFVLSDDQMAAFEGWWNHTMGQGCGWFLLLLKGELEESIHAARIAGGYQADLLGGKWRITARLDLDDPPHLSADDYAGMILQGALSIDSAASALHALVHVSIPVRVLP